MSRGSQTGGRGDGDGEGARALAPEASALVAAVRGGDAVPPIEFVERLNARLGRPLGADSEVIWFLAPEAPAGRTEFAQRAVAYLWDRELSRQAKAQRKDPRFASWLESASSEERAAYTARRVEVALLSGTDRMDAVPDADTFDARRVSERNRLGYPPECRGDEGRRAPAPEKVNPYFGKTFTQFRDDGIDTVFGVFIALFDKLGWAGGAETARAWSTGLKGWFDQADRADWRRTGPWNPETGERYSSERVFGRIARRADLGTELGRRGYATDGETIDEAERRGISAFPERKPGDRWDPNAHEAGRLERNRVFNGVWGELDPGTRIGSILYPVADAVRYGAEERYERERRMGRSDDGGGAPERGAGARHGSDPRPAGRVPPAGSGAHPAADGTVTPGVPGARSEREIQFLAALRSMTVAWANATILSPEAGRADKDNAAMAAERLDAWLRSLDSGQLDRLHKAMVGREIGSVTDKQARSGSVYAGLGADRFGEVYRYAADPRRATEGFPALERPPAEREPAGLVPRVAAPLLTL